MLFPLILSSQMNAKDSIKSLNKSHSVKLSHWTCMFVLAEFKLCCKCWINYKQLMDTCRTTCAWESTLSKDVSMQLDNFLTRI